MGLGDVEVLSVEDEAGGPLRVHVRRRTSRSVYGGLLWSDGERAVELVDLPVFGRAVRLAWHKRRWRCAQSGCSAGTVTEQDPDPLYRARKLLVAASEKITGHGRIRLRGRLDAGDPYGGADLT